MKPILILLAGPTCAGKSTVARAVRDKLPQGGCEIVALDRYYCDLSGIAPEERAVSNFDHPDAIDWPLLNMHVETLLNGQAVSAPTYDFTNHVRGETVECIPSTPVLIVEGVLALWDDSLAARASLRVFIDAHDDTCLQRRIERDVAERGRSMESIRAQFATSVQPMADRYVRPTKCASDVVLDSKQSVSALTLSILKRIPDLYRT